MTAIAILLTSVTFLGLRWRTIRAIIYAVNMRPNGSISRICWIKGLACPRRYLSLLPSHVRANLFGSD